MPYPLVRWVFEDPVTAETHTFSINPNEGGSPTYAKKFDYQATAGPNGKTLVFEGRDEPQKLEFSGVLLEKVDYDALVTWFGHRNQVNLTDDLGRTFSLVIENLTATRKRSALYPYKHEYKVTATVVDWP